MAQYCVFCEKNFQSFTALRYHKCSPNDPIIIEDYPGDDKENVSLSVDECISQFQIMLGKSVPNSNMMKIPTKNAFQAGFEEFSADLNKNFDMNENSMSSGVHESSMSPIDYSVGSGEQSNDDTEGDSEVPDYEKSEYVYVFDTDGNVDTEEKATELSETVSEDANPIDMSKTDKKELEICDGEVNEIKEVLDETKSEKKLEVVDSELNSNQSSINSKPSDIINIPKPDIPTTKENNQIDTSEKHNGNLLAAASKVVGASRRKRKFCLESTISQIMRTKTVCREKMDCLDAFNNDKKLEIDVLDMAIPAVGEVSESPNKVFIKESKMDKSLGNISPCSDNSNCSLSLSANSPTDIKSSPDSGINLSLNLSQPVSETKPKVTPSVDSKPNRRKRSFVKPVQILKHDIPELESDDELVIDEYVPLDLTADLNESQNHYSNGFSNGYESPSNMIKTDKGVLDLSSDMLKVSNNKVSTPDLSKVKKEPNGLPADFIKSLNMAPTGGFVGNTNVKQEAGLNLASQMAGMGLPGAKPGADFNPVSQALFLEWINKFQTQFPQANTLTVNAAFLQFQMWMQNMLMTSLGNGFNMDTNVKNDHNENIVKTENGDLNSKLSSDFYKFNLDHLQKAGMMQNIAAQAAMLNVNGAVQANAFKKRRKPKNFNKTNEQMLPTTNQAPNMFVPSKPKTEFEIKPSTANAVLSGLFSNQSVSQNGEVKFHVKDNEQINLIVNNLIENGNLEVSETTENSDLSLKFICRVCGHKFFHLEHLTRHVKKVHILKKYQCKQCDRSFHDAGNFRQHMRVHDESDIPFACLECDRKFRHKCTLKVHLRIHSGEKPFKCTVCTASFKISSGLQTHMRKHTGETPYACEFCNMRFKCQSNLKQHLFQHTQVRPFPCDVCGKSYSRKSIRDSHMQTHFKTSFPDGNMSLPDGNMSLTDVNVPDGNNTQTLVETSLFQKVV